ncbi:MAG: hydrolase [Acidimicrobiia bacterium]|nr:hydrolase [Acidimicrobiia bacterium]
MKALQEHLVPIDLVQSVDRLVDLAEVNSSTYHRPGLDQTLGMLLELFSSLEAESARIALADHQRMDDRGVMQPQPLGEMGAVTKRPGAPIQLLLVGHYDTVFGVDHSFQHTRFEEDRLVGPGTADMKGGLLVLHAALTTLEQSPWAENVGWELLLTPDEEIGSPGSAPFLEKSAAGKTAGFIFEPSFPDGHLAGERKGSGTFDLHVSGIAAHAGRDHHLGRNAVMAAARLAAAIDDLNGTWDGVTINVGAISGGGPTNIVPDHAVIRLNVRVPSGDLADEFQKTIEALAAEAAGLDGIRVTTHGTFTRRPKEMNAGISALLEAAKSSANALGFELGWRSTGGVSDGNNLAAAGLPNLDNLGVHGGNIHSDSEFMYPRSLESRSALAGMILLKLASGELTVPQ